MTVVLLYKLDGESFQYLLQLLIKIIDNNNCNIDSSILLYNLLVLVQDEHSFRSYYLFPDQEDCPL